MKWVHNALRQLANTHKAIASLIRSGTKEVEHGKRAKAVGKKVAEALEKAGVDPDTEAAEVVFTEADELAEKRSEGVLAFDADVVFAPLPQGGRATTGKKADRELLEERVKGIAQVLDAYGAFEGLNYERQQLLLQSIVSIIVTGE